jgi:drug/metabolite transporter (DMT)-like permease
MFKEYSPLKLTTVTMAIGAIPLVIIGTPTLFTQDWAAISFNAWLGLGFSAFFAIGIGYVLWYTGVNRIGSARTSLYDNLVTVFAVASAWVLLSEVMSWVQVVGAVLVFVSLYAVRRKKNREKATDVSGQQPRAFIQKS